MKWAYSLQQKTKIAFWSALILTAVFVKNWMDKNHVTTLDSSFASVYDDRLVVEGYLFQLSGHLYQKKIILSGCHNAESAGAAQPQVSSINSSIDQILSDYEKTKLTPDEATYFGSLKKNLAALNTLEGNVLHALNTQDVNLSAATMAQMQKGFDAALLDLGRLSEIQILEGKLLKDQSNQIAAGATLLSTFELVVLIAIGILIQILVFASKSTLPRLARQPGLN